MPAFNGDRASTVLVEAIYIGDPKAAEKYGCSVRAIQKWRNRLSEDSVFAALFAKKKERWEKEWAAKIPEVIRAGLEFVMEAFQEGDRKDPKMLEQVNTALKTIAELEMSKAVIDARLSKQT